jgi:hypothetical protein
LEMRFGGNPIEGSNPSLSATFSFNAAARIGSAINIRPCIKRELFQA